MAKPKGSSSFVSLTIAEIRVLLGGNENIPVKVSKGWVESAKDIFGTGGVETESAGEDEAEDEDKGKGGVRIEE